MKCLPLYLLLLPLAVSDHNSRAGYFVEANFLWYNNSLDSYPYVPSGDEGCCFSQRNCSEDCVTQQRICFKDYESVNNISDDSVSGTGCIGGGIMPRATLSKPVEYIDYSEPPLDMKKNRTIPTMINSRNSLGRLQLFIRVAIGMHIVEYFQLDFELSVNDPPMNLTLNGSFYGSYMTFALRLTRTCLPLYYGDNCSIYCKPEDSDGGHYTCLSNGTKQCLPGYQNTSTDCTTCVPATGCNPDYGYCKNPGDCVCIKGYKGENCSGMILLLCSC
ncbi:Protein jagged-1b [Geodia barretti]|uniref:Delta-like protein n=2 Tax=Geodia barretti TaxID=519541 RepID=A0AA35TX44_GEOBA|nr:Protein jagged-1b [Geodia barretti]